METKRFLSWNLTKFWNKPFIPINIEERAVCAFLKKKKIQYENVFEEDDETEFYKVRFRDADLNEIFITPIFRWLDWTRLFLYIDDITSGSEYEILSFDEIKWVRYKKVRTK